MMFANCSLLKMFTKWFYIEGKDLNKPVLNDYNNKDIEILFIET